MIMTTAEMQRKFSQHPVVKKQADAMAVIRQVAFELAVHINNAAPDGDEKEQAIRRLQEAVFWANAGIARGK